MTFAQMDRGTIGPGHHTRGIPEDHPERNPNVFYEIGMAHTVGKKVVLIARSSKDIPSDIQHFDYTPYDYDPEGVETLIQKLRAFFSSHFKSSARTDAYDKVAGSSPSRDATTWWAGRSNAPGW